MHKTFLKILMLSSIIFLAACSAAPTPLVPSPTQDLNPLRTEVAATVLANIPNILALTPSATMPPTATTQPTSTATITPTATPGTPTPATNTPLPQSDNQAKYISQTIADGTVFTPGQKFTQVWTLENVGKTTWKTSYILRYYSGDTYGALKEIPLDTEVAPGQQVQISVDMKAPAKVGKYRSDWVMATDTRFNFNQPVYLEITVALPATSTPTQALTPTVTPTK
jgi:hypothetical protein